MLSYKLTRPRGGILMFLKSWYYVPHDRARGTRSEEHNTILAGPHYPISLVGWGYVPRCKITPSVGEIKEHYPVLS